MAECFVGPRGERSEARLERRWIEVRTARHYGRGEGFAEGVVEACADALGTPSRVLAQAGAPAGRLVSAYVRLARWIGAESLRREGRAGLHRAKRELVVGRPDGAESSHVRLTAPLRRYEDRIVLGHGCGELDLDARALGELRAHLEDREAAERELLRTRAWIERALRA